MITSRRLLLTGAASLALTLSSVSGAIIAQWNFQDSNLAPDTYDSSLAADASVELISLGSGVKSNGTNGSGWLDLSGDIELATADTGTWTTLADAKTGNSFIEFTLNPTGGTLTIDDISTRFGTSGSTGTRAMEISYAIGAGSFTDLKNSGDTSGSGGGGTTKTVSYDFTTETTHGTGSIVTSSTVTFRFYAYNGSANRTSYFDDITINGSVTPVPEPGTYALLAGALSLLCVVIRRRK